ncbi:MAG TPA: CBS domain-containing protein [Steroidobacteraceae bacterium]|jgi:CBS domain-containing protein|nr:CBS domain-containing protein [Steroidobacteraceae bacterium]HKC17441.1 CBS domain-containing protein [Steroidobacteraceae bacterium]HMI36174.1 CBS domain-containing protein [Steroidobacteraceae bacterium]
MATAAQLLGRKPRAIYSIGPDAPVLEAVRLMAEYGVGALLVMTGDELVGVISERDYARKVILMGRSSSDTPVHQIMTKEVFTVEPGLAVEKCMEIMTNRRFRHLPVVEAGRVIGMLSIGDLVRAVLAEQAQTIEQLESYIHS